MMNIPQFDQDLATLKATQIQFENGYHLSDKDLQDFNDAIRRLNDHALKIDAVELSHNYRTEQIRNHMTTHDSYKLKITNENSETKWLNVTPEEVKQIAKLLNKESE